MTNKISNSKLYKLTLKEASDKLESGEITSLELTNSVLSRIEQVEPKVEAFITVTKDLALKQAEESDKRRAEGKLLSSIDGIPVAVKDLFAQREFAQLLPPKSWMILFHSTNQPQQRIVRCWGGYRWKNKFRPICNGL